jgi:hypothetical protein
MRIRMNWFRNLLPAVSERGSKHSPTMIAVGLIILVAKSYWSAMPVMSGMALITLGATLAVASRFRCSPALPALIAAHFLLYSMLYLLFIGAVLHAAFAKSNGGLGFLQALDLAVSILPMATAIRISIRCIAGGVDAPAR